MRFYSPQGKLPVGSADNVMLAGSDGADYFGKQNIASTWRSEEKQGAARRFLIYAL